jgi:hypothetical protein
MTPATHEEASPTFGRYAAEEMAKYGITRVPTDYFHYKEYRYTNLDGKRCFGGTCSRAA